MLTPQDLESIGRLFEEKISLPDSILNVKLDAVQERLGDIEARLTRVEDRLDTVDNRLTRVENTMLTRHDLERWETGQTERYDTRYVRRPASRSN